MAKPKRQAQAHGKQGPWASETLGGGEVCRGPQWGEVVSHEERQPDVGGEVESRDSASTAVSAVIAAAAWKGRDRAGGARPPSSDRHTLRPQRPQTLAMPPCVANRGSCFFLHSHFTSIISPCE